MLLVVSLSTDCTPCSRFHSEQSHLEAGSHQLLDARRAKHHQRLLSQNAPRCAAGADLIEHACQAKAVIAMQVGYADGTDVGWRHACLDELQSQWRAGVIPYILEVPQSQKMSVIEGHMQPQKEIGGVTRVWEMRNFALISCGLHLAKNTEGTTTKQGYTCLAGAQAQQSTSQQSTPKALYIKGYIPHTCKRAAVPQSQL